MPSNGLRLTGGNSINNKIINICLPEQLDKNQLNIFLIISQLNFLNNFIVFPLLFKNQGLKQNLHFFCQLLIFFLKWNQNLQQIIESQHMNIQNRAQSFKSQPKTITIARNSQTINQQSLISLKQRPLLDNHKNYYTGNDPPLMSAKVRIQRPQQYLIRSVPTQKQYESEIQKLNQICEQFFIENEKLKHKINNSSFEGEQILKKKIQWLQSELEKNKQDVQIRNRLIQEMANEMRKVGKNQNNFQSQTNSRNMGVNNKNQSALSKQLLEQLQIREKQLIKYMHKESQFVQIYVEKQQLEQQVRKYELMTTSMAKEIEQLRRKTQYMTISESSILRTDQKEKTVQRIKQYNEKLLKMLQVSSCEIQRLNNILKLKIQEIENKSSTLLSQKKEIELMRQMLDSQTKRKDPQVQTSNIQKIPQQIESKEKQMFWQMQRQMNEKMQLLSFENADLQKRLGDQLIVNEQLRSLVDSLSPKQQINVLKLESAQVQTQQQQQQGLAQGKDGQNTQIEDKNKTEPSVTSIEVQQKYHQLKKQKQLLEDKIKNLEQKVKDLLLQRQESSKFIIGQNKQMVNVKKEVRFLSQANDELKKQISKMQIREKQLTTVFTKMSALQQKLAFVTRQYDSLLTEVQSSRGQAENIQKQLEMMIQEKYSVIEGGSQDHQKNFPNLCRSQTCEVRRYNDTSLNLRQNDYDNFLNTGETSIRIAKRQMKSSSQSQLLNNI